MASAAPSSLEHDLFEAVAGEVDFEPRAGALYGRDASHYRQPPLGVVHPRDAADVEAALAVCRKHGVPIVPRGAGTSLAGQGINSGVVFDFTRHMNRILSVDRDAKTARVQPGVVLDDLRDAAEKYGLTFGPDPSTHAWCTLGGMIGNNACGVHSVMAGKTVDNVERLEVLTYEGHRFEVGATTAEELELIAATNDPRGRIYGALRELGQHHAQQIRERFPSIPRRVSGYNLDDLLPGAFHPARALVGTEGTCVLFLEATVRLVPDPPVRVLVLLGYADMIAAGTAVPTVMAHGPIGLEGTDHSLIENMRARGIEAPGIGLLQEGRCWLLVEFGGRDREDVTARARGFIDAVCVGPDAPHHTLLDDPADARAVWQTREAGAGASSRLSDGRDTFPGWEDAAVDPARLGEYLREFDGLTQRYGLRYTLYGHFGQGCIHTRLDFDLVTSEGIARYRAFVEEAARLVVKYGGSLSGEHGDGHARAELLPIMFGAEIVDAFRKFKRTWDPGYHMNPGKIVDPYPLDSHLALGAGHRPSRPKTYLHYPDDDDSFGRAVGRCVGVGKCTRVNQGGTMCPSYMVTRREQHSTRGRAHLLQEMTEGRLPGGWDNEAVHEALYMCLACKGCKQECPAGVDVAAYKAEFLAHYHERHPRCLRDYAFGWIDRWARMAELNPGLANLAMNLPRPIKRALGIAPGREFPRFAPRTFRASFQNGKRRTLPTQTSGQTVVLWADTFNDHFHPEIAHAAAKVLMNAGFSVQLPQERICCGRPLYDFGMLDLARRKLEHFLRVLSPVLDANLPIIGLEPSCISVIRDELSRWFPGDGRARSLAASTYTLGEFLSRRVPDYQPPRLSGPCLFHPHCHHAAVLDPRPDRELLRRTGLDVRTPDAGCCGMAGSFGFMAEHERESIAIGERVLLPAVDDLPRDAWLVTDGFSCREQIRQTRGRRALHLAEVLANEGDDAEQGEGASTKRFAL